MSTHRFAVVAIGPEGSASAPLRTSDSQRELIAWLTFNRACLNKPGSNIFETEDGVVYEILTGEF